MNIGIDIDGVINDLTQFHISCGSKFCYNNNLDLKIDISGYDSSDIFKWGKELDKQFWAIYYLDLLSDCTYVRPFVSEVINKLKRNNSIYIISSRQESDLPINSSQSMLDITQNYLKKLQIQYDKLILTPESKHHEIIKNNVDIMIEDNPSFFNVALKYINIPLLCFDTPYNKKCKIGQITRVYSWYDILNKIKRIQGV